MIIIVDDTYLDVDKVNSIIIKYNERKETVVSHVKWWNPFTWSATSTKSITPSYNELIMDYVRDDRGWTYTVKNTNYGVLQNKFKKIVEQLKMQVDVQNQEMLDKLFEATIKNGDSR